MLMEPEFMNYLCLQMRLFGSEGLALSLGRGILGGTGGSRNALKTLPPSLELKNPKVLGVVTTPCAEGSQIAPEVSLKPT